ncbi:hypothetical protein BRD03_12655 [Halobacteriales archaeon QS_9_68_17]|nr:MAG: hypothetical protein BRD03_12655 [Halobacteriales archaeon QS_9_68_17]
MADGSVPSTAFPTVRKKAAHFPTCQMVRPTTDDPSATGRFAAAIASSVRDGNSDARIESVSPRPTPTPASAIPTPTRNETADSPR